MTGFRATAVPLSLEPVSSAQKTKKVDPFTLENQKRTNWCWAAVAVSVASHYEAGTPRTQCAVASETLRRTRVQTDPEQYAPERCCNLNLAACDEQEELANALDIVGHPHRKVPSPLKFLDLWVTLPTLLCARMESLLVGHYVSLVGATRIPESDGTETSLALVGDPKVESIVTCDWRDLESGYLWGTWTDTYWPMGGSGGDHP